MDFYVNHRDLDGNVRTLSDFNDEAVSTLLGWAAEADCLITPDSSDHLRIRLGNGEVLIVVDRLRKTR